MNKCLLYWYYFDRNNLAFNKNVLFKNELPKSVAYRGEGGRDI